MRPGSEGLEEEEEKDGCGQWMSNSLNQRFIKRK